MLMSGREALGLSVGVLCQIRTLLQVIGIHWKQEQNATRAQRCFCSVLGVDECLEEGLPPLTGQPQWPWAIAMVDPSGPSTLQPEPPCVVQI